MTTMFKIRSRKTGLFSAGGAWPKWNTVGKVWKRKGDLSSHFTQLGNQGRTIYLEADAEVVVCETVVLEAVPVDQYIEQATTRAADRQAAEAADRLRYQRQHLEREQARIARALAEL